MGFGYKHFVFFMRGRSFERRFVFEYLLLLLEDFPICLWRGRESGMPRNVIYLRGRMGIAWYVVMLENSNTLGWRFR